MNNFPLTYNAWHLVHLSYNSDSAVNDPSFWVNAISESVSERKTPSGTYLGDSSTNLNIGNSEGTTRTWDGLLDEFRMYDGILPTGWINTEYNNQVNPSTFYSVGLQEIP